MKPGVYEVVLEKRSRGKGFSLLLSSWATRTVILRKQTLEYFSGGDLKGLFAMENAITSIISPVDADFRPHAFCVDNGEEIILFNAPTEC